MITRDKLEGFLLGVGAGALFAAFIKFREEQGEAAEGRKEDDGHRIHSVHEGAASVPVELAARAARR